MYRFVRLQVRLPVSIQVGFVADHQRQYGRMINDCCRRLDQITAFVADSHDRLDAVLMHDVQYPRRLGLAGIQNGRIHAHLPHLVQRGPQRVLVQFTILATFQFPVAAKRQEWIIGILTGGRRWKAAERQP